MANEFTERMRSIGFLGRGRTKSKSVVEGKVHPDSGAAYKATTDDLGHTTTEHNTKDDRVDVLLRPQTARRIGNG